MAVFNMQKPTTKPVGNPAIGYNKPQNASAADAFSIGGSKPADYTKPGQTVRPPGSAGYADYSKPQPTKPPMQGPSHTLPYWYRRDQAAPPSYTMPVGPGVQMQANIQPQGGGYGYSQLNNNFGGGNQNQGRLAEVVSRLFGY
jgi:hypothetical protein